jgi:hypothetical protein
LRNPQSEEKKLSKKFGCKLEVIIKGHFYQKSFPMTIVGQFDKKVKFYKMREKDGVLCAKFVE